MVQEQREHIGKTGSVQLKGLKFAVKVLDVRQAYGCIRYLVTPVAGSDDKRWIENVTFEA